MLMDMCSLLLGHPWGFHTYAIHHGRPNNYTHMHQGKKITLVPKSLAKIVKYDQDKVNNAK
jgi:hypothetical protein